jgi:hypothetical protein
MQSFDPATQSILPPELTAGPIARQVRLVGTALIIPILMIVVFTGIPTYKVVTNTHHRDALRQNSGETMAEIKDAWHAGRGNVPTVSYTFSLDGAAFSGEATVPEQLFPTLHQGDSLAVRYVPSDPSISHPADWEWVPTTWDFLMPFFFVPITVFYGYLLRSQHRLATQGIAAAATVTDCSSTRNGLIVKYDFQTEDGRPFHGSGSSPDRKEAGTRICILYLPDNPRRSNTYPLSFYRILPAGEL